METELFGQDNMESSLRRGSVETVSSLVDRIELQVDLLQQLHILCQTESLILENLKLESLCEVVEEKESVVAKLDALTAWVSATMRSKTFNLSNVSAGQRQKLATLKAEAVRLIHLIHQIDSKNLVFLQNFKAEVVQSSHDLRLEFVLHSAYMQPIPSASLISEVAE